MTREELLQTDEYHIANMQIALYGIIEEYMKKNDLSRKQLAEKLGVSKGYITQVLSGDYDHKISKLVELALASDKIPVVHFVDKEDFIKNDAQDKYYELVPIYRPDTVVYRQEALTREQEQPHLYQAEQQL